MQDDFLINFTRRFKIPPKLAKVLLDKGIRTSSLLKVTLDPRIENLIHPRSLPNLKLALSILKESISEGLPILVWGHEDTDGITSVSIVKKALETIGVETRYYIPSKDTEGHGLYKEGIDKVYGWGIRTIITVDCCGSDKKAVEYAKKKGMKVIITDHHEVRPSVLPDPPVVNPKLGGGSFPYLAGAGVAFKFTWALLEDQLQWSFNHFISALPELLVWAALGSVADRVPLYCENRAIVSKGQQLYEGWQTPIKKVFLELEGHPPSMQDIMYIISSARSKMGVNPGVDLLLSRNEEEARSLFIPLWEKMKNWTREMESVMQSVMKDIQGVRDYILVDLKDTPPHFLGHVASRLKEQFNVPVIALGRRGRSQVAAEVRAPKGFNSLDLLEYLGDILLNYGGHKPASGFSMDASLLPVLVEEVEAYFRNLRERGKEDIEVDIDLEEGELDPEMARWLLKFAELGLTLTVKASGSDLLRIKEFLSFNLSVEKIPNTVFLESSPMGLKVAFQNKDSNFKNKHY